MAVAFTNLSWWLWSRKYHQEPKISKGASVNCKADSGMRDSDALRFALVKNLASSSRRVKRKWHSREERKLDRKYDVVLVPSDGGCVSGSESDDSNWSLGGWNLMDLGSQVMMRQITVLLCWFPVMDAIMVAW